jgi:hypothetical protein
MMILDMRGPVSKRWIMGGFLGDIAVIVAKIGARTEVWVHFQGAGQGSFPMSLRQ